jgi:HD-GYP domain-containing protein (c-di-GMP phosphodiesterase class II)
MTSDRPYRAGRSWEEAAEEILREASKHFDPDVVAAFVEYEPVLRRTHGALVAA